MWEIHGRAFVHREKLKSLGCRWQPETKCWVSEDLSEGDQGEIRSLIGVQLVHKQPIEKEQRRNKEDAFDRAISMLINGVRRKEVVEREKPAEWSPTIIGDGELPTNIDQLAFINASHVFTFTGLQEMVEYVRDLPAWVRQKQDDGWKKGGSHDSWTGSESMDHALDLATNGWGKGVELAESIVDELASRNTIAKIRKFTVTGGKVSIPRFLQGQPNCFRSRPKREAKHVITFYIDSAMSSSVDPEDAICRAAAIGASVDLLEKAGFACEIIACQTVQAGRRGAHVICTLKNAGEALNLNDLVFALGHPSYLRRLIFAVEASNEACHYVCNGGYGTPADSFDNDQLTKNQFHVRRIDHGCKFDKPNFTEQALAILNWCLDKRLPIEFNGKEDDSNG